MDIKLVGLGIAGLGVIGYLLHKAMASKTQTATTTTGGTPVGVVAIDRSVASDAPRAAVGAANLIPIGPQKNPKAVCSRPTLRQKPCPPGMNCLSQYSPGCYQKCVTTEGGVITKEVPMVKCTHPSRSYGGKKR